MPLNPFTKAVVRALLPERWRLALRRKVGDELRFSGPYSDWETAVARCRGYSEEGILRKVRRSALRVKAGHMAYEQDSMAFAAPSEPRAILQALRATSALTGTAIHVLDFGGSLGSSYFRVKPFLGDIRIRRWSVCEQPHFVKCGRAEFEDDVLRFIDAPEDTREFGETNLVLLSGVLPYLPDPLQMLARLGKLSPALILIDRTPVGIDGGQHCLVQHVPWTIYSAEYPLWLLPKQAYFNVLAPKYELLRSTPAEDAPFSCENLRAEYISAMLMASAMTQHIDTYRNLGNDG